MKNLIGRIVTVLASSSIAISAFAHNPPDGCQTTKGPIPFANFHQVAAHYVGFARISATAYVQYDDVYNQTTLSIIVNGKVIASSTALMGPVQISAIADGEAVNCRVSH